MRWSNELFLFFIFALAAIAANADECRWEKFADEPYAQIAFPDTAVRYFRLRLERTARRSLGLFVEGRLPEARYVSLHTYDRTMSAPANGTPVSLSDLQLKLDADRRISVYVLPAAETARNRDFVAPGGKKLFASDVSHLAFASDAGGYEELWLRLYLPEGTPTLPTVTAFDLRTGAPLDCPHSAETPSLWQLWTLSGNRPPPGDAEVRFYRPPTAGLYANVPDNRYLAAAHRQGSVSVFSFRKPARPSDVRYFSVCTGGGLTQVADCLVDDELPVSADGRVHVAVGPASQRQAALGGLALAGAQGVYLSEGEWPTLAPLVAEYDIPRFWLPMIERLTRDKGVILLRYLLPRPELAAMLDRVSPTDWARAETMGDYAPVGETWNLVQPARAAEDAAGR